MSDLVYASYDFQEEISHSPSSSVSSKKHSADFKWTEIEEDVSEAMSVFLLSFSKAYESFSKETLKLTFNSKEEWLEATFKEEEQDFKAQKTPIWLLQAFDQESKIVIGVATVEPDQNNATTTLYIRQMAVHPSHQKKGIGKGIIDVIEKRFSAQGFKDIVLLAREVNQPAIDFYTKTGFESHGYKHPDYEGKPYIGFKKSIPAFQ
jgi:ribosomal protein S18 acetylase RimI-like enzyme